MVKWSTVGQANIYRVGHKGKVMQYTLSGVHMYHPISLSSVHSGMPMFCCPNLFVPSIILCSHM